MILHKLDGTEIEVPKWIELEGSDSNSCHVLVSWEDENKEKQSVYVTESIDDIKKLISNK